MQLEFTRKSISDEGAALKETLRDLQTAAAKSLQSCPIPCDPIDGSHQAPPSLGFSRQEHWSGLPLPSPMQESEKWKWSRSVVSRLFATPWTAAYQAPPSMGFSRQEYWSGVPLPSPEIYKGPPSTLWPGAGQYIRMRKLLNAEGKESTWKEWG